MRRWMSIILCLFVFGAGLPAQTDRQEISGTIRDEGGLPVPGVGVLLKGTATGAVSELDGSYRIHAKEKDVLVFSCLGYQTREVTVGTGRRLDIVLQEDNRLIDEVVVVGYATMKKRDLVGAVDQVDSRVIGDRSNGTLARSLQGEIAGLNVTFNDSKPSRTGSLNVRGTTSIGAGGSSLILIDGVEGDLNAINPQDVESVSVLKDASSTAVYGARGAFGVILITTKNPEKGQVKINYSGSVSANRRTVIYDNITDSVEWLDWWVTCYENYYRGTSSLPDNVDGTVPYSEAIYQEIIRRNADPNLAKMGALSGHSTFGWAYYDNVDWYDLFYKDYNLSTEHNVSVSGSGGKADYYVSGRYFGQDGIYRVGNENYKKYDLRAKGSVRVTDFLKVTNNMSVSVSDWYQPKTSRNEVTVQRFMNHACYPLIGPLNPDGTWTAAAAVSGYAAFSEGNNFRQEDGVYLREKISADLDILPERLKFQADYSFNYTRRDRTDVQKPVAYSKKPGVLLYESESAGDLLKETGYATRYQAANAYMTWTPNLGANHSLTLLAGYNVEMQSYETRAVSRKGFTSDTKYSFALMDGETTVTPGGNEWSYEGFFYRLNYAWKGKYLFEFSGRYDGSSKFPPSSRWGFFPSVSAGWRFSDEPFLGWARTVLDNGKLRISAGSMGNGNVSPYLYTSEMSVKKATDYVLSGGLASYSTVGSVVPVSLTWETAATYDAGLDMDLFGNRLSFTGDVYLRETTDMYTASATVPAVYGTSSPKGNNAELRTTGWELSLQWRDAFTLAGSPFEYSVKGTLWDSRSVITKYAGNDTRSLGTIASIIENHGSPGQYYEGMTLGEMWGWTVEGLFKDYEDVANSALHNFLQSYDKVTRPGQVKIADLDGSGVIDYGELTTTSHGDLRIVGDSTPHYLFGLNLSGSWKGFGLSVFLQGIAKKDWYPGADSGYFWGKYGRPYFAFIPTIHRMSNPTVAQMNEDNTVCLNADTAYWPIVSTHQSNHNHNFAHLLEMPNTRYMQNAAYLRVKNLQLDYSFQERFCTRLGLKGLKVYVTGENLFTLTPLHKWAPNFDPEGLGHDVDFEAEQDGNTYPVLKTLTLGINVTL